MPRLLVAATIAAGLFIPSPTLPTAHAATVGRIIGNIDGISQDGDHFFISGWACQQGQAKPITVHVFAEDAKDPSRRIFVSAEMAELYNEPAVGQACQDAGRGKHRFMIALPYGLGPNSKLHVHGIRVVDGVPNDAIAGSGLRLNPLSKLGTPYPPLPRLAGAYHALAQHPRVFISAADLKDLVTRINRPGSYSMQRFGLLADQIQHDLASGIDWDVTYSGCDGGVYQYTFSYEPQDHHDTETRAQLRIAPDVKAPAGAAVVASRLALYAALVKGGAIVTPNAPSAEDAAQLAKRILLAWADRGFRDDSGRSKTLATLDCGDRPKPEGAPFRFPRGDLGLPLGRGVVYSVQTQDLLQSFRALSAGEQSRLNAFHGFLFDLLRQTDNEIFATIAFPYAECARYTNLAANPLAALLAMARLLDDGDKLNAVLFGHDRSTPVLRPWVQFFDRAIYGVSDSLPSCAMNNRAGDSLTSLKNHWDYQTTTVAPGEISDRGRNANPGQGIGYPMFTLERLFNAAEILRNAGFDPYGYRGAHQQSIEAAMQYYACYAKGAGFYKIVTPENSRACPNAAQYYGKLVNGVDRMALIGAYRFPQSASITELEADARAPASSGAFTTDAILFGKWRD